MHRNQSEDHLLDAARKFPLAIALWVATQALAQDGPQPQQPQMPRAAALSPARSLAATCANCHGTQGQARGGMAVLAGVPSDRLRSRLADYRSGAQAGTVMGQIAKGYTEAQLQQVAEYFASLPPPR
jgi:cytochrome c553